MISIVSQAAKGWEFGIFCEDCVVDMTYTIMFLTNCPTYFLEKNIKNGGTKWVKEI